MYLIIVGKIFTVYGSVVGMNFANPIYSRIFYNIDILEQSQRLIRINAIYINETNVLKYSLTVFAVDTIMAGIPTYITRFRKIREIPKITFRVQHLLASIYPSFHLFYQ